MFGISAKAEFRQSKGEKIGLAGNKRVFYGYILVKLG
jgi:hypothetical protein